MTKKMNIICHAFPSWRGNYVKSTIELMKVLALQHNVLYIDYAYTIKDVLINSFRNPAIQVKRIFGWLSPLETFELNQESAIHVLSLPPIIPYNWINKGRLFDLVQSLNNAIINRRINAAIKNLQFIDPILINAFNPYFRLQSKSILVKARLYYCYDNIAACRWTSKHGPELESRYIDDANAVIYTSDALQSNAVDSHTKTFVIKNGVDISNFRHDVKEVEYANTDCTIHIGYIGSIDDRLDYELLNRLLSAFPKWVFHFIGRVNSLEATKIFNHKNAIYHGILDASELPRKMMHFNAGIIPFVKNEMTKNIYPMKANEYLAMGLPVVMTNFASLHDLEGYVTKVDSNNFEDILVMEVNGDNLQKKQARIKIAHINSWENKAKELEEILLRYA